MVSLYYHSRAIRAISYAGTAPRPSAPLPPGLGARSRRDLAGSWDEWHDLWMRGEAPLVGDARGGGGMDEQAAGAPPAPPCLEGAGIDTSGLARS